MPVNPMWDNPMAVAIGNIYQSKIVYSLSREEARQQIRDTLDYTFTQTQENLKRVFCSGIEFEDQQQNTRNNFETYFEEWQARVTAAKDGFEGSTTTRGQKWHVDSQRQLLVIPQIRQKFFDEILTPNLDAWTEIFENEEDPNWTLSRNCLMLDYFLKDIIAREEDLELFDLYNGFDYNWDFASWSEIRRKGTECNNVRHSFSSSQFAFPCGFYYEEDEDEGEENQEPPINTTPSRPALFNKVKGTILISPLFLGLDEVNKTGAIGWTIRKKRAYVAKQLRGIYGGGEVNSEYNLEREAWADIKFECKKTKAFTFLGTDSSRGVSTAFTFDGKVFGGEYWIYPTPDVNNPTPEASVYSTEFSFSDFFKSNGEYYERVVFDLSPSKVINFSQTLSGMINPECAGTASANEYIYSGEMLNYTGQAYGPWWGPPPLDENGEPQCEMNTVAPEPVPVDFEESYNFFQQILDIASELTNVTQLEVGTLKFVAENDEVLYETPIYGNWKIWQKFDVTLRVKEYWFTPPPPTET